MDPGSQAQVRCPRCDEVGRPRSSWQGLTLVHFSAQPEPFLSQKHTLNTPYPPLRPIKHPVNNPLMHPLSRSKRLRGAEKWTSVSPCLVGDAASSTGESGNTDGAKAALLPCLCPLPDASLDEPGEICEGGRTRGAGATFASFRLPTPTSAAAAAVAVGPAAAPAPMAAPAPAPAPAPAATAEDALPSNDADHSNDAADDNVFSHDADDTTDAEDGTLNAADSIDANDDALSPIAEDDGLPMDAVADDREAPFSGDPRGGGDRALADDKVDKTLSSIDANDDILSIDADDDDTLCSSVPGSGDRASPLGAFAAAASHSAASAAAPAPAAAAALCQMPTSVSAADAQKVAAAGLRCGSGGFDEDGDTLDAPERLSGGGAAAAAAAAEDNVYTPTPAGLRR